MSDTATSRPDTQTFIKSVHGIRYHVKDVARSVTFYTQNLGFKVEHQRLPAFASVNRIVLRVSDLPGCITLLQSAGVGFRNEMESGPGGRQIQIEDPDGNPLELFEPSR